MVVHSFAAQLARSNEDSIRDFWRAYYTQVFPDLSTIAVNERHGDGQRSGLDTVLVMSSGKVIRIQEKMREKDWPDILLEFVSVDKPIKKPGWIEKDMAIDFIAYAFLETQRVHLLSWPIVRLAWLRNKNVWLAKGRAKENGFRIVPAQNRDYTTWSLAVPLVVLDRAMSEACKHTVYIGPDEEAPPVSLPEPTSEDLVTSSTLRRRARVKPEIIAEVETLTLQLQEATKRRQAQRGPTTKSETNSEVGDLFVNTEGGG